MEIGPACLAEPVLPGGWSDPEGSALLVTQAFPFAWMGGNQAVRQLRKACQAKGAHVCASGVVNWSRGRERKTSEVVDRLSKCFGPQ